MLFVVTLYGGPKARNGKGRGSNGSGLYPQLAPFGFSTGVSPALVSTVARLSVLMPSFEHAHREMYRPGVLLNLKTVRRITERLGLEMLTARKRDLMAWRAGQLQAGDELAGQRIGVAIYGGRTRLRENQRCQKHYKRRGKRIKRRRSDWPWSSPDMPAQLHERPAEVNPPEPAPPQSPQTLKNKE